MTNRGFWQFDSAGSPHNLNACLLQRGTFANRPSHGQEGRVYLVVETDLSVANSNRAEHAKMYQDTGNGWEELILTRPPDVQTFNASGTWTRPSGARLVKVQMWGGGASSQLGGGGGAGGNLWFDADDLPASVSFTIGAGAAAATQTYGGNTFFNGYVMPGGGRNALGEPFSNNASNLSRGGGAGAGSVSGTTSLPNEAIGFPRGGDGSGTSRGGGGSAGPQGGKGSAGPSGAGGTPKPGFGSGAGGVGDSEANTGAGAGVIPGGGGGGSGGVHLNGAGGRGRIIVTTYF